MTVTYAAFTTRGGAMVDTVTGAPVRLEEFPPPLGHTPLPDVRLLEDAAKAVVLPEKKHLDTSCVIQFHVYAPVDGSGRRSMATITFVDVAAFRLPLCRELQHLTTTVQRVAGVAPAMDGGDAQFKETKLTTLLEPALQGYVTMVSITTLSGRPDLHEAACAALQFAQDVSRVHQVLMLVHLQTPRWFFDAARQVERLREERGRLMEEHYARGVHAYYTTARQWLEQHVCDVDGRLGRLLHETEEVRRGIAAEADAQHQELRAQAGQEEVAYQADAQAASAAAAESARRLDERQRLEDAIAALERQLTEAELESGHHVSEMRLEVAALEAQAASRGQERQQAEKEAALYQHKAAELQRVLAAYAEELSYAQSVYQYAQESELLRRKRLRLEADLQLASRAVRQQSGHARADLDRRSRLSRLTAVQQRVEQLRESTAFPGSARATGTTGEKKSSAAVAPRAGSRRSRSGRPRASPL
ncbi:hypothetical protein STCU_06433 [Strigomonas culicis]|uniref:Kinesin motor domain-containing protein n=1 Tax=Strigomonas culicis TaxID=28005 RepID=S9VRP1_9TRYP|nr:hypothetical protein STCU_06433 [Strigomonas culicis]|eukprot:EPY25875.1 hypothetical protein STCU_06433 [Strigomonas culicis]